MSIQELFYRCIQCKSKFRFNNKCKCPMCGFIDAQICLSCHNNNHIVKVFLVIITGYMLGNITGFIGAIF